MNGPAPLSTHLPAPPPAFMSRRRWAIGLGLGALSLLSACASPPRRAAAAPDPAQTTVQGQEQQAQTSPAPTQWSGRLALLIETDPVQHFSAGFELSGDARSGVLRLFSAFGQTLAQAHWSPQQTLLQHNGRSTPYASMDDLTAALTGVALPLLPLFAWLSGQPAELDGWQADLSRHAEGRLQARRLQPGPAVELRLLLH